MTYTKPKIQVTGTTLMGEAFHSDARTNGSDVYEALKAHKTVKCITEDVKTGGPKNILIPFHAVKKFAKSVVTEDAERNDPYCGGH